jgi:hypothetical protein
MMNMKHRKETIMKKVFVVLVMLLVLSMIGTAVVAQEEIDSNKRLPVTPNSFGPSQFDLAAPWGVIDAQDLLPLQLAFGKPVADAPRAWDINHDGAIDIVDLAMVAARQGCTITDACYYR